MNDIPVDGGSVPNGFRELNGEERNPFAALETPSVSVKDTF
jgi:hypothetical protein